MNTALTNLAAILPAHIVLDAVQGRPALAEIAVNGAPLLRYTIYATTAGYSITDSRDIRGRKARDYKSAERFAAKVLKVIGG